MAVIVVWVGLIVYSVAAGCGRVGFEPIGSDGNGGPAIDGGAPGDGGVAVGCNLNGNANCTGVMNSVSPFGSGSIGSTTGMFANVLQGSCGGDTAGEYRVGLFATGDARLQLSVSASFDTVLYALRGDCDGAEIACQDIPAASDETIEVVVSAGEEFLVVADGQNACGAVSIEWVGMGAP